MGLDYLLTNPLSIVAMIELFLALALNSLLFYIVYKHTPLKMKDYRIILLAMATAQFLIAHAGIGSLPDYLYPLPVLRLNGYFTFIGPKYGGHFMLIQTAFFFIFSGLCVLECSMYRFYVLKHQKYHLKPQLYVLSHLIISLIGIGLGIIVSMFFLPDIENLLKYAKLHNYSTEEIDFKVDVLIMADINSSTFYVIAFLAVGAISAVALIIYVLNLMTHRHMKRYISKAQNSSINYQQQQRLTLLLVGQGSLPLLITAIIAILLIIGLPDITAGLTISKNIWEIIMIVLLLYPLLSPILTIVLTKPYYEAFKLMLMCRRKQKHSRSATIIKL